MPDGKVLLDHGGPGARRGDLEEAQRQLVRATQVSTTQYLGTFSYPYAQVEVLLARATPDRP